MAQPALVSRDPAGKAEALSKVIFMSSSSARYLTEHCVYWLRLLAIYFMRHLHIQYSVICALEASRQCDNATNVQM